MLVVGGLDFFSKKKKIFIRLGDNVLFLGVGGLEFSFLLKMCGWMDGWMREVNR